MSNSKPKYLLPFLAAASLLVAYEATAERQPLTPHTTKLEVNDPEFTIVTDASGDYLISYQGEKGKPVKVVFAPPNKVRLTLAAAVSSDDRGNFTYRYEPATAAGSPPVTTLVVRHQGAIFGVTSPPGWEGNAVSFLPAIAWRPTGENRGLAAASHLAGFALSATLQPVDETLSKERSPLYQGSLPGIVDCHAGGTKSLLAFPDEPPGGISDHLPRFPYQGVGGRTVGPVVVPRDGQIQIPWLLERLRSYTRESHELGWLDPGSNRLQEYLQALDQIESQVEAKSNLQAQNALKAFRRRVELDFLAGALTSEAEALLRHNSAFLERLLR